MVSTKHILQLHNAIPRQGLHPASTHAFNCADTYVEAFRQALTDGEDRTAAAKVARVAHDRAVTGIRDNVGLD